MMRSLPLRAITVLLLLASCFFSCGTAPPQMHFTAPGGKYIADVEVNREPQQANCIGCLSLTLREKNSFTKTYIKTDASDHMAWAAAWHPSEPVFILSSSDIGTLAWRAADEGFQAIDVSPELIALGDAALKRKYKR